MFSSRIVIEGSETEIESYFNALLPEESEEGRAGYKLKKDKGKLIIDISAKDATAFRAVTNTLAGLIQIIEKNLKVIKSG